MEINSYAHYLQEVLGVKHLWVADLEPDLSSESRLVDLILSLKAVAFVWVLIPPKGEELEALLPSDHQTLLQNMIQAFGDTYLKQHGVWPAMALLTLEAETLSLLIEDPDLAPVHWISFDPLFHVLAQAVETEVSYLLLNSLDQLAAQVGLKKEAWQKMLQWIHQYPPLE